MKEGKMSRGVGMDDEVQVDFERRHQHTATMKLKVVLQLQ